MLNKLKNRKYIGLIGILILVIGIIGILNVGHYDFSKNKLTLTNISANRLGASVVNTINEIAYNENVSYEIKYTIKDEKQYMSYLNACTTINTIENNMRVLLNEKRQ